MESDLVLDELNEGGGAEERPMFLTVLCFNMGWEWNYHF